MARTSLRQRMRVVRSVLSSGTDESARVSVRRVRALLASPWPAHPVEADDGFTGCAQLAQDGPVGEPAAQVPAPLGGERARVLTQHAVHRQRFLRKIQRAQRPMNCWREQPQDVKLVGHELTTFSSRVWQPRRDGAIDALRDTQRGAISERTRARPRIAPSLARGPHHRDRERRRNSAPKAVTDAGRLVTINPPAQNEN